MLCGCATNRSTSGEAIAAPAVNVSALETCERMLVTSPMPAVKPNVDDANVAFVKDEAALIAANKRIVQGRRCVTDVRRRYAPAPAAK